MAPTLPRWIEHEVSGYVNGHAECRRRDLPVPTRVYATESLYGDWRGRVLLLAKDLGESSILTDRIAEGDQDPYRHLEGMRTNEKLTEILDAVERETAVNLKREGLLFGSALANLWRGEGRRTGTLQNKGQALAHGSRVLQFVIENMPHLRWIVCMNEVAWQCAVTVTERLETTCKEARSQFVRHRDTPQSKRTGGGIELVATYHPAAIIELEKALPPWKRLARSISA